ncbi:MAG: hypothetical protein KKC55_14345 [Gammaproteobacteria bacterium]|nr:hypothetical protein [Gammaproteobacteria bacterium]
MIVVPKTTTVGIVVSAQKAISHHDPSLADESNSRLFNRRPMLVSLNVDVSGASPGGVFALNPVPPDMVEMFRQFSVPEFVASAFVAAFVDAYNTSDGMGHFGNADKFQALRNRLKQAAVKSFDLCQCWGVLCEAMGVGVAESKHLFRIVTLYEVPRPLAYTALGKLIENSAGYVTIAQYWHDQRKLAERGAEYAASRGQEEVELVVVEPSEAKAQTSAVVKLDVPAISENSLRHQLREAGYRHLFAVLGIERGDGPGWGVLPEMVEALFVNGGNIVKGASAPAAAHALAAKIRTAYRLVDLFSGTTKAFWLGTGKLTGLRCWLVCRENAAALPIEDPLMDVSAFDMLDSVTETRRATERGVGQMIQNFETVVSGAKLYAEFDLDRYTHPLTLGAFQAALDTYLADRPELGGQSARGYGFVDGEIVQSLPDGENLKAQYEASLVENREALRAGLIDGTLTTGVEVI